MQLLNTQRVQGTSAVVEGEEGGGKMMMDGSQKTTSQRRTSDEMENRGRAGGRDTYIFASLLDLLQDISVGCLGEARLLASLGVVLEALTDSFGAIVECIAKGLMDACQLVPAGHENLGNANVSCSFVYR